MDTYSNMITVINNGKKTKEDLLKKCDVFLMNDRVDEVQYTDLVNRINEKYE